MNQLTHWLDGSQIYGHKEDLASRLRERVGGRLKEINYE